MESNSWSAKGKVDAPCVIKTFSSSSKKKKAAFATKPGLSTRCRHRFCSVIQKSNTRAETSWVAGSVPVFQAQLTVGEQTTCLVIVLDQMSKQPSDPLKHSLPICATKISACQK